MNIVPFRFQYSSMDDLPDVVSTHQFHMEMCFQLDLDIFQAADYLYPPKPEQYPNPTALDPH